MYFFDVALDSVVLVGLASRFMVKEVFSKIVCFICLRLGFAL